MRLHDTHCHLDLYPEPDRVAAEIEALGIHTIAVTNTPSVFRRSAMLTQGKTYLRTALGFHPELAASRRGELGLFRELVATAKYIGEVGLDFTTTDEADRRVQEDIFQTVLETSAGERKVITVHSRRASERVLELIGTGFVATIILHWYSGPLRLIDRAAERGLMFSVNAAMVRSKGSRRLVAAFPRDRVLLESDGPFVQIGDRPSGPADGGVVVSALADLWQVDVEEVGGFLQSNFRTAVGAEAPCAT